jgi:hypothetical protein
MVSAKGQSKEEARKGQRKANTDRRRYEAVAARKKRVEFIVQTLCSDESEGGDSRAEHGYQVKDRGGCRSNRGEGGKVEKGK